MTQLNNLSEFLIFRNKQDNRIDIAFYKGYFNEIKVQVSEEVSALIGYKYSNGDLDDGEYVSIHIDGNVITINNDYYASIPVYIYEDTAHIVLSSSIYLINQILPHNINLNSNWLYTYFAFGYLPATTKTIYKNITTMEPNSELVLNEKIKQNIGTKILREIDTATSIQQLINNFNNSVKMKSNLNQKGENSFCLSSGFDSLLGALSLKSQGATVSTSTWGAKDSDDILAARARCLALDLTEKHFELIINGLNIGYDDYCRFSNITGGISPTSSIYLMPFTEFMVKHGKFSHLYCDFLEITRRHYKTLDELKSKYITPKNVSAEYFIDKELYNIDINEAFDNISRKYDNYMQMYLLDRCVKGAFYKNAVIRTFGSIKSTFSLDAIFLQTNYSYVMSNGYSYNALVREYSKSTELKIDLSDQKINKPNEHFSFSALDLISKNNQLFNDIINENSAIDFSQFFDLDKIKVSLYENQYIEKSEWFFHRLFNLLIFKKENSIGIS